MDTKTELTADRVDEVVREVLFKEAELINGKPPDDAVLVEGVVWRFGFHRERLEARRADIIEMLRELPDNFRAEFGGGWSFLMACNRKDGVQWGEHRNMEALFVLAIGLGLARWLMPRDLWPTLPGGMPYVAIMLPK